MTLFEATERLEKSAHYLHMLSEMDISYSDTYGNPIRNALNYVFDDLRDVMTVIAPDDVITHMERATEEAWNKMMEELHD